MCIIFVFTVLILYRLVWHAWLSYVMKDLPFPMPWLRIQWLILILSWLNNYPVGLATLYCSNLSWQFLDMNLQKLWEDGIDMENNSSKLRLQNLNFFVTGHFCSEFSQYALLLSYSQYCRHMLDSDVPMTILQFLSVDEQDYGDSDLEMVSILHSPEFHFVAFSSICLTRDLFSRLIESKLSWNGQTLQF